MGGHYSGKPSNEERKSGKEKTGKKKREKIKKRKKVIYCKKGRMRELQNGQTGNRRDTKKMKN
jgi:hypothetical protein